MKSMILTLAALGFSGIAHSQQYYAPNNRDLEPQARFTLEQLESKANVLSYTLPAELTGSDMKIVLDQVEETPLGRIYRGDKGTAQCMGELSEQVCVVVHKDLFANEEQATRAFNDAQLEIEKKYKDPTRSNATTISEGFLESIHG